MLLSTGLIVQHGLVMERLLNRPPSESTPVQFPKSRLMEWNEGADLPVDRRWPSRQLSAQRSSCHVRSDFAASASFLPVGIAPFAIYQGTVIFMALEV